MQKRLLVVILTLVLVACQVPQAPLPAEPAPTPAPEPEPATVTPPIETPVETKPVEPPKPVIPAFVEFDTKLPIEGAYNGPLFDTGPQMSSTGKIEKYFENMDRNGVNYITGYFSIDYPPNADTLYSTGNLGYMLHGIKLHPHRIVPFFSLSIPPEEIKFVYGMYFGDAWSQQFKDTLAAIDSITGKRIIRGFGEIEQFDFGAQPNDGNILKLYDYASEQDLMIYTHPNGGEYEEIEALLQKYPNTVFVIHMYREDFVLDRERYINLLKRYPNFYFQITMDHMSFDGQDGMLYKYEDKPVDIAVDMFLDDYERGADNRIASAVRDYGPLVEAVPDKVLWGTEMGRPYTWEPEVYDKIIEFSRKFIGFMKPEHQEGLAYKNALRVYGKGAIIEKNIPYATGWPDCTPQQMDACATEADACGRPDTQPNILCEVDCTYKLQCTPVFEESS